MATKKVLYKGVMVEAMDMTPTWEACLPVYLEAIQNGSQKGRDAAILEITRMAKSLDSYNAKLKAGLLIPKED